VPRDFDVVFRLMANDRAERWVNECRIGTKAGLDIVGGPFVIAFFADDGADERDVFHLLGDPRQPVGDLDAFCGRLDRLGDLVGIGRAGMRIERLKLAGSTFHVKHDQRLRRSAFRRGFRSPRQPLRYGREPGDSGQAEEHAA
jgi:hypothetical protein